VTDRVRDEVRDEPLDEVGIAGRPCRLERYDGRERTPVVRTQRVVGDRREVDGLAAARPLAASDEGKARVEQSLLPLARAQHVSGDLTPDGDVRTRIRERELEERALRRQRRPQLVSCVGEVHDWKVETFSLEIVARERGLSSHPGE